MNSVETMLVIMVVYLIGYVVSVIAVVGWTIAHYLAEYPKSIDYRGSLAFALPWAIGGMVIWPITLFIAWCVTDFARHGWRISP